MSASIHWSPISTKHNRLSTNTPSRFVTAMEMVFGGFPIQLENDHETTTALRGMHAGSDDMIYACLLEALEKFDRIRVWAEY